MSEPPGIDEAEEIRIALPSLAAYARVGRLALTGLASRFGWSYDDLSDLRILVGELFAIFATEPDRWPAAQLVIRVQLDPGAVTIEATREPPGPPLHVSALSRQILEAVVDRAEVDETLARIRTTKRREG